jgi:anti-sigma factor RsiW
MTEKSCREIEQMLVDYADGQLSPSQSSEVAEHLAGCRRCSDALKALQRSLELVQVVWEDGWADAQAIHISKRVKTREIPRWAYATAAAVLAVAACWAFWHYLNRPALQALTVAEIERRIMDEGMAARLLAATELLAGKPYAEELVKSQYNHIVERYPSTEAAATAKTRIR